jgi:hypothetical protein
VFEAIPDLGKRVFTQLLQSPERYFYGGVGRLHEKYSRGEEFLYVMNSSYSLLMGNWWRELDQLPEHLPLRDVIRRWQYASDTTLKKVKRLNDENLPVPRQFLEVANNLMSTDVRTWKTQLEPWSAFIEPARQIWGAGRILADSAPCRHDRELPECT